MRSWGLPRPPTPDELARSIPAVAPVAPGIARPRWSVMIPTHNCAGYLGRTLASVLAQDPGRDAMQVEVIDDCSTTDDPAAVVAEVGRGRVAFTRNPANLGPTATFNVCVQRAVGHWVHVLHGDDLILPGFYDECREIIERNPDVVMIVGQTITIDSEDRWTDVIGIEAARAGTRIDDFLARQAVEQLAQFAGVVVRRDAYEKAGGFCTLFGHAADLDMWFRVGECGAVWCTRRPYGLYRVHSAADTAGHVLRATNVRERHLAAGVNLARLGLDPDGPEATRFRRWLAHRAYRSARKLYAQGLLEGSLNQIGWALRLNANGRVVWLWLRVRARKAVRRLAPPARR